MIAFPTLVVAENVATAMLQLQSLTICARLAAATRDLTVRENTVMAVNLNRNTGNPFIMLRRLERGAFFFGRLFLIAFAVHENLLWLRELNLPLCVFIGSFYSGFTVGYDNRGKNNPKCFIVAL